MDKFSMIDKTKEFVKDRLYGEGSGHDWFHIERVYNLSKHLAEKENAEKRHKFMEAFWDEFYAEWNCTTE